MALAGTLKDFGLPDIVQLIGLQRKTGTLHLTNQSESVNVLFDNGNIVAAESSNARPSDRIGSALVTHGYLTQEQLNEALTIQKQTMQRLGHVLISENLVNEEQLRKAVEAQLLQVVFRLFRWREGTYNFETQNTVDYEHTGSVSLGADFILMEGIRMVDEWPIIERKIPTMAAVFRRVVDASQVQEKKGDDDGLDGILGSAGESGGARIMLSSEEMAVFNAVDGRRSCAQIVEVTPLHDFAVCRALLDLMDRDVVALTDLKGSAGRGKSGAQVDAPGLALMAVAVLASLFGIYRNLTSPFGVFGLPPLVQPVVDVARGARVMERLEDLDARVRGFRIAYGRLPSSMDELVSEGLATRESVEGVQISVNGSAYVLEAPGPRSPIRLYRALKAAVETALPADPAASTTPAPVSK